MKKQILLLIIMFISGITYAQSGSSYALYLNNYTSGDTVTNEGFGSRGHLYLLKNGKGQQEAFLDSYEIAVYNKGKISVVKPMEGSVDFLDMGSKVMADGTTKFVIEAIVISIKQNGKIIKMKLPPQTFYRPASK